MGITRKWSKREHRLEIELDCSVRARLRNQDTYGFNPEYMTAPMNVPRAEQLAQNPENLKTKPLFLPKPAELFSQNESVAKQYAKDHRYELLAQAIPSRTLPVGANEFTLNPVTLLPIIESINMHSTFKTEENKWPRQEEDENIGFRQSWYHSDFKAIGYPHNYKLYDYIINKGDLK